VSAPVKETTGLRFDVMRRSPRLLVILGLVLLASVPAAARPLGLWCVPSALADAAASPGAKLGPLTRDDVEKAVPAWVQAEVDSHPDSTLATQLTHVDPGAVVTIYFGTWCGDSRRELSRLWRAFDDLGIDPSSLPFTIRYVGIDEKKKEPADAVRQGQVRFLPTIIVERDHHELGRIVESPPDSVEGDLLGLLTGSKTGLLTRNQELLNPSPASRPPSR
jgi:hypothetical protein